METPFSGSAFRPEEALRGLRRALLRAVEEPHAAGAERRREPRLVAARRSARGAVRAVAAHVAVRRPVVWRRRRAPAGRPRAPLPAARSARCRSGRRPCRGPRPSACGNSRRAWRRCRPSSPCTGARSRARPRSASSTRAGALGRRALARADPEALRAVGGVRGGGVRRRPRAARSSAACRASSPTCRRRCWSSSAATPRAWCAPSVCRRATRWTRSTRT